MDILTTDAEISAAVAAWLEAHPKCPADSFMPPIARFRYEDGTFGSVSWRIMPREMEPIDPERDAFLVYRLNTADHTATARVAFTPEIFHDSAVPIIPILHRDTSAELARFVLAAH